ncbi:hypothetical protein ONR57_12990 [Hoyosella sp. YIM 151337]|uniref:sensor histidine kinase n=1 Tax=Hoyosella sp. YIM 151337 TaxID=2992742 RepID=UPI0022358387|nr:ATP-binding protein [Hoyosella sp. YIM 151337]MCW4354216.1 hypothetical protein [Hoyosella sp. YIM 151337]
MAVPARQTVGAPTDEGAERLSRSFAQFIGWGAVFYGCVVAPLVISQRTLTPWWWTPLFAVLLFGTAIALIPVGRWGTFTALRRTINAYAFVNVLVPVTWLVTWTGEKLPTETGTWHSYLPGLAAVAGAIIWRFTFLLVYLVTANSIGVYAGHVVRWQDTLEPLLTALVGTLLFSTLFACAVFGLVRTGRILDATALAARTQAIQTSATEACTAERRRVNALVHDAVMATLIAAARSGNSSAVARHASATIDELELARSSAPEPEHVSADELASSIRATVSDIHDDAHFSVSAEPRQPAQRIPGYVKDALCAGVAEALRNVRRHAGADAQAEVRVAVGHDVRIDVTDNGSGFDPSRIPDSKLGLRGSILGRFDHLPGGFAAIASKPGCGATVSMRWAPQ